jgi:hypothetical protein
MKLAMMKLGNRYVWIRRNTCLKVELLLLVNEKYDKPN